MTQIPRPILPPTDDPLLPPRPIGDEIVKRRRKHKPVIRVAALNITSMMDLVLNLLLFFVLTSNFSLGEGVLPATLPTGGPGAAGPSAAITSTVKPPENPIVISLRSVGSDRALIQIEGTGHVPQDAEELYVLLERWNTKYHREGIYKPDNPITIKPDRSTTWKQVVDAFNAVIRARYTDVGFAPAGG